MQNIDEVFICTNDKNSFKFNNIKKLVPFEFTFKTNLFLESSGVNNIQLILF